MPSSAGAAARRAFSYLGPYRRMLLLGALCLVGTNILSLLQPWVMKHAVDAIAGWVPARGGLGLKLTAQAAGTLLRDALWILALAAVGGVLRFYMRFLDDQRIPQLRA